MDIQEAIELLKKELDEIPKLRTLTPEKQQYKLWFGKVCNILELTSGIASRDYDNFARAVNVDYPVYTDKEKREKYNKELDAYETALKSVIHKYELLDDEGEPSEALKPQEERQSEVFLEKDEKSKYQKIWQWIDTHRILSILAAIAAIATTVSVVIGLT